MAINERKIQISVEEGSIDTHLTDLLKTVKKGKETLRIDVKLDGDLEQFKALQKLNIEPKLDLTQAKAELRALENEFNLTRERLAKPININIETSGGAGAGSAVKNLQNVTTQAQAATKAGQNLSNTYAQVGEKISSSVRNMQRQLELVTRTQKQAESAAVAIRTTKTIAGLPVRKFTDAELASGASTRIDQRLLLRGLDQANVIPGKITRQTQISPSAAASEYIRQEENLRKLNAKKESLEFKLQNKLADEARVAEAKRQAELRRTAERQAAEDRRIAVKRQNELEAIARKASAQNVDIGSLRTNNPATESLLNQLGAVQGKLGADPTEQAKQLVNNAARVNKIAKEEFKKISFKEFFATSADERQNIRLGRVKSIVEKNPNIPGLEDRLKFEAKEGSLPSKFSLKRLNDPAVASQILFGGLFGGNAGGPAGALLGAGSAALGGAIGGAPGALVASTAQQVISGLVDPVIEAYNHRKSEYQEAGAALSGSILSIGAALQQSTEILDATGTPLGSKNIQAQLALREREATEIQVSARKQLLPQGIGGATEATFVRGIIAALGQRGITANANEVGQISRILGGVIQTQRPQLLENTSLLNRDLQDVLSGLPQANRTILGSLIRSSLPKLQKASTGADVVKALQDQSAFADVAIASRNPQAIQNKLQGAKDQLNTLGGDALLKAKTPALELQATVLNMEQLKTSSENLGRAMGTLDAFFINVDTSVKLLSADAINAATNLAKTALKLNPTTRQIGVSLENIEKQDKIRALAAETVAIGERVKPENRIKASLEGAGLEDTLLRAETERQQSTLVKLNAIDKVTALFSDSAKFKEISPSLLTEKIGLLGKQFNERTSIFSGSEGELQSSILARKDLLPAQLQISQDVIKASSGRVDEVLKRLNEAKKDAGDIDSDIAIAKESLGNFQKNRPAFSGILGNLNDPQKALLSETKRANTEAKLNEEVVNLEQRKKENAITSQLGDTELQNLTDQLIDASRQELKLKDQVVELSQKETDIFLGRISKLSQVFDTGTQIGAVGEAGRALIELNRAAQSSVNTISLLESELDGVGKSRSVVQSALKSATDPGVIKQRQSELAGLDAKEEELQQRRLQTSDQLNVIETQRLKRVEQRESARNIPLTNRAARQDTFTFEGQLAAAQLSRQVSLNEIATDSSQIGAIRSLIRKDPNALNRPALEQQLVNLQQKQGLNIKNVAEQDRNIKFTTADRSIAQIDLSLVLRKSQRLIEEETNKRKELNVAVALSTERLRNFGADLKASQSGREEGLLGLVDQFKAAGGTAPAGLDFDEDTRQQIRIGTLRDRLNAESRKFGLGDVASGGTTLGLASPGSEVALEGQQQGISLATAAVAAGNELFDFAKVIKKQKEEFEKEIASLTAKNGPGEQVLVNGPTGPISDINALPKPTVEPFRSDSSTQIVPPTVDTARPTVTAPGTKRFVPDSELKSQTAVLDEVPIDSTTAVDLTKGEAIPPIPRKTKRGSILGSLFKEGALRALGEPAENQPLRDIQREGKEFADKFGGPFGNPLKVTEPAFLEDIGGLIAPTGASDFAGSVIGGTVPGDIQVDKSKRFKGPLGPYESSRHANLRQDIAVDLASVFSGTEERQSTGSYPSDRSRIDVGAALFAATSGTNLYPQKSFTGSAVANTQLPTGLTAKLPKPPDSEDGASPSRAAQGDPALKALQTEITALKTVISTLTSQGLKLSGESVNSIGSQLGNIFNQ